jgi:hypothetical protein
MVQARPWEPTEVHGRGPRRWAVWQRGLFGAMNVHKKGNGRERRFNTRQEAQKFADKLNKR